MFRSKWQMLCGVSMLVLAMLASPVGAQNPAEEEFQPLFNGENLEGWVVVNVAPETFTVRDGMIVSTGIPTGTLRTERMYENFVIELEWRHMKPGGNAGLFIWGDPITHVGQPFSRGIEVQILDGRNSESYTSHGDVFPIWGATMTPDRPHPKGGSRCLPSEHRCKPSPEWNHYRVVCNDGVIKLSVNGKEVSGGSKCSPRKGYLCLESEGSECHFRNIRIHEMPSTNPSADETALEATGFVPLYTGVDLSGWRQELGHQGHWQPKDWILEYDGKSTAADKSLWTEKEYGDFELICDWRLTGKPKKSLRPVILPNGELARDDDDKPKLVEVDDAGDSGIYLRGSPDAQVNIWCWPIGSGEISGYRKNQEWPAEVRAACTPKTRADKPPGQWNRFVIRMKGDRISVKLNGETVIDDAQLPEVAAKGPIALQHFGDPVQFANLFIRELEE
jgi:hypothetical protein